jgi:UDP-2-acetamido-3-amino-2,3-dideoxy-glucuronate N-acetyltransferase
MIAHPPLSEQMRTDPRFPGVLVHESAYIDEGVVSIGAGTRVWHFCHLMPGCEIGRNCSIGQNVMIGPRVRIGNGCKIQNNVSLYEGVVLEDDVFCGPSAVFTNVRTPRSTVDRKQEFHVTRVRRGATIGANATIVCGNEVGEWCLIGAGAVVTSMIVAHSLALGNPARRRGWVSRAGEVLGADLVCPRTQERYAVEDNRLIIL